MADPSTPYIGSGLPAKIVETDGITTLFRYAARELGDALAWWQIADLNGLSDPWVGATRRSFLQDRGSVKLR